MSEPSSNTAAIASLPAYAKLPPAALASLARTLPSTLGLGDEEDGSSFADLLNSLNPSASALDVLKDSSVEKPDNATGDDLGWALPPLQLPRPLAATVSASGIKPKPTDAVAAVSGDKKAESLLTDSKIPELDDAMQLLDLFNPSQIAPPSPTAIPYWMANPQTPGLMQQFMQMNAGGLSSGSLPKGVLDGMGGGMTSGLTDAMLEKIQSAHKSQQPIRIDLDDTASLVLKLARGKVSADFLSSDLGTSMAMKQSLQELRDRMDEQKLPVEHLGSRYSGNPQEQPKQEGQAAHE